MVRTARDEITTGTEHWWYGEWKDKGRVAGARLKPDLVWLRRDSGGGWRKVVVDVKITSTDKLNEHSKKRMKKPRVGQKGDPREEGGYGRDGSRHHLARRSGPQGHHQAVEDLRVRHQSRLGENDPKRPSLQCCNRRKFFNKGGWVSEAWRKEYPEECDEPEDLPERIATADERMRTLNLFL